MSNGNMSGLPGVEAVSDTLEFVKKMWGGMSIPGMVMPSLSVNEINKQIADLKAVESWLSLNMNMLRGTIQALEVQSATIATLQSMGDSISSMVQPSAQGRAEPSSAFSFAPPTAEKPPAPRSETAPPPAPEPARPAAAAPETDPMAAQFANPAAWWNMLQDQFKQAVNTAVVPEPAAKARRPAAPPKKSAKARKTAPRKPSVKPPKA